MNNLMMHKKEHNSMFDCLRNIPISSNQDRVSELVIGKILRGRWSGMLDYQGMHRK